MMTNDGAVPLLQIFDNSRRNERSHKVPNSIPTGRHGTQFPIITAAFGTSPSRPHIHGTGAKFIVMPRSNVSLLECGRQEY